MRGRHPLDGARVREAAGPPGAPTIVLLHGGPGGYDHSYFKPDFAPLTAVAQVVYLDLRDHGRSARQGARRRRVLAKRR